MKDAELVRSIIRLRSVDRPPDDVIAQLGKAELASQPEATIVAIVKGYYEFKSNGYEDADIYREIEGRREQVYGEEPLPADLNLDNYTRYRMRLEYPGQAALHDPVFVMQAVHKVREALEKEYGPGGMPITFRSMPWLDNALLAYAALFIVAQGIIPGWGIVKGKVSGGELAALPVFIGVALGIAVGTIAFVAKAAWGRSLLLAALGVHALAHSALVAYMVYAKEMSSPADFGAVAVMMAHVALVLGFMAYVYRSGRAKPAPA
ncbi:MAG: hypothetical protein FIB05_17385 [Betaproteobacteria bacterium]|nr:hypothetical protein [Betaproteobacteria bacterium]